MREVSDIATRAEYTQRRAYGSHTTEVARMPRANGAAFNGGDLSSNNPACTYNGFPVGCGVVIHAQAVILQGMPDTQYRIPSFLIDRY
jgi:hypothetical protein